MECRASGDTTIGMGIPLRDGGMYLRSTSRAFVHTVATLTTIVCLWKLFVYLDVVRRCVSPMESRCFAFYRRVCVWFVVDGACTV